MRRKTLEQVREWRRQHGLARAVNELTGLNWTVRQLLAAGRSYVTPDFRSAWRRERNRGRMQKREGICG